MVEDLHITEWKSSLDTVSKYDGTIVDLRKFGFSFITGLTTAQGFFAFSGGEGIFTTIGVLVVTMILVVLISLLDVIYNTFLLGSWMRARFLEKFWLETTALSEYTSGFGGALSSKSVAFFLYFGFLCALLFLGMLYLHEETSNILPSSYHEYQKLTRDQCSQGNSTEDCIKVHQIKRSYPILYGGFGILCGVFGFGMIIFISAQRFQKRAESLFRIYQKGIEEIENDGNIDSDKKEKENRIKNLKKRLNKRVTEEILVKDISAVFKPLNLDAEEKRWLDELEKSTK